MSDLFNNQPRTFTNAKLDEGFRVVVATALEKLHEELTADSPRAEIVAAYAAAVTATDSYEAD